MNKINKIHELQMEIDILESERSACDAERRQQIDRKIDDLHSIIDCLMEACS